MKVLVCGGRDFIDKLAVWAVLHELHSRRRITHLIHGGAKGADWCASSWAITTNGVLDVSCEAQWGRDGKAAGPIRNAAMLELKPDLVIAFPGGRGTENMVRLAKAAHIPVREECSTIDAAVKRDAPATDSLKKDPNQPNG